MCRLGVFKNRVLRRIFRPKKDEVTEGLRSLHNEELHDLYSSPSIIRIIKSWKIRWGGVAALTGRRKMFLGCWLESQREGHHQEAQDVVGWITLGWIL
jgi:hypothetical protein